MNRISRTARLRLTLLVIGLLLVNSGCFKTRGFYRRQANADAYALVQQKKCPDWPLDGYTINVDPSSRMFDPCSIDCPPMPPDDPTAHQLMHCVDCKRGYPCWHANGDTPFVQNPQWADQLPFSPDGAVRIDVDEAVRLALVNSPVYQQAREDLYLSALDVSFERFRFDGQYFGGYSGFFELLGADRNGGQSSSTLGVGTFSVPGGSRLLRNQLFATGADLAVGLANSLVWEFSGRDTHTATTLIDFAFIQPFLRGGGRDVVLEQLTQSERDLLGNVRQMERFRRSFYVEIVAGRAADRGPVRGGLSLGGLNGFTGTSGQAAGYLGILQGLQDIRNQRSTIASLQSSLAQLDALFLANRIDFFQVELARQALLSAQSRLLNSERALDATIDNFNVTLGLPPYVELVFDDSLISEFQLVDPEIAPLQNRLTRLQQRVGETMSQLFAQAVLPDLKRPEEREELPAPGNPQLEQDADVGTDETNNDADASGENAADDQDEADDPLYEPPPTEEGAGDNNVDQPQATPDRQQPSLRWSAAVKQQLTELQDQVREILEAISEAREKHLPVARQDNKNLRNAKQKRRDSAQSLREKIEERLESEREERGIEEVTDEDVEGILPFNAERLDKLPLLLDDTMADIAKQLQQLEQIFGEISDELQSVLDGGEQLTPEELHKRLQNEIRLTIPSELNNLSATVLSLILVQARARTEAVTLPTVNTTWQAALNIARENRLDWMNARSSLVDSWRRIQFTANDLEAQLDFTVDGDIGNVGDNPLDIRTSNGRLRFGLEFDAPLTRLVERNTFRESQILYEQARRAFYQFGDGVAFSLRDIVRRLDINQIDFEIQRAAVEVAISQVELARLRLQEPPRPNAQAAFSVTTARDLVTALQSLLAAQNDFLNVWIQQEVLRRLLDLDRGTMRLDSAGIWLDPDAQADSPQNEAAQRNGDSPTPVDALPGPVETIPLPEPDEGPQLLPPNGKLDGATFLDAQVRPASFVSPATHTAVHPDALPQPIVQPAIPTNWPTCLVPQFTRNCRLEVLEAQNQVAGVATLRGPAFHRDSRTLASPATGKMQAVKPLPLPAATNSTK